MLHTLGKVAVLAAQTSLIIFFLQMIDELIICIVQTILLVPVLPHGVLQLGSLEWVRNFSPSCVGWNDSSLILKGTPAPTFLLFFFF